MTSHVNSDSSSGVAIDKMGATSSAGILTIASRMEMTGAPSRVRPEQQALEVGILGGAGPVHEVLQAMHAEESAHINNVARKGGR